MEKLKILVTAEIDNKLLETSFGKYVEFEYAGYFFNHEVLSHEELINVIPKFDVIICEYDTIDADVFQAAVNLKMIICCRGGVKQVVDLDIAMERGIIVCNNPGRNAGAVTDLVIGFILDLTRNITITNNLIHNRILTSSLCTKPKEYVDTVWGLDNNSPFIKYRGKSINHMSLGIVGFGNTGSLLAKKAYALGMKIYVYDPYSDFKVKPQYAISVSFEELLKICDIVSLHCILSPQTKNMFSKKSFDLMKKDSIFINTSRGELVVEKDLIESLNSGHLFGAAIDVTCQEPIPSDSVLLSGRNLLITPHIAGSSFDVQYCGTQMVIEILGDFLAGKKPKNCVVYK